MVPLLGCVITMDTLQGQTHPSTIQFLPLIILSKSYIQIIYPSITTNLKIAVVVPPALHSPVASRFHPDHEQVMHLLVKQV